MKRLGKSFFRKQTIQLARALLGCTFVYEHNIGTLAGIILETEAYTERDEASHTFGGRKTHKNEAMFSDGGHLYVYFTYGMHHCMNIVSEQEGFGSAVLLRALHPRTGLDIMARHRGCIGTEKVGLTDGPGKLCQAFDITRNQSGIDLTDARSPIYLLPRQRRPRSIQRTPRIGISRAKEKLWRFRIEPGTG